MSNLTSQDIAQALAAYVVLLFSLSVHESAHAWMALRLGDDTAEKQGRVSLNPIVHMDPVGTVLMPLLQFLASGLPWLAWAKPTPYNPANFRPDVSMRKGHMLVAAAGPTSNFILAVLLSVTMIVIIRTGLVTTNRDFLYVIVSLGIQLNVLLAVFNLIPIPPLDGSKVASFGLPGDLGERYDRLIGPYGFLILMVLVMSGALGYVLDPIRNAVFGIINGFVR